MNPLELTPLPSSEVPILKDPFFDYSDFFFFLAISVPCIFLALLPVRLFRVFIPVSTSVQLLVVQGIWYFLLFGCVALLFRIRYQRPFWQSLGWRTISLTSVAGAIIAGPLLAFAIGLLGSGLRAPKIDLPFEELLGSRGALVLIGIIVVVLGPIAEELAFRGFLMPLLIRSMGTAAGGIVLTGLIFGSVHGYEYRWSWQYILLISLAGCIFGWAKYKTQSTAASALMHSTFNLLQFVAFLTQTKTV